MTTKQQLLLILMGSDPRISRSAIGYVGDLGRPDAAESFRQDRLNQLRRYVPELVEAFLS
jgi:hypothetical protein